MKRCVLLLVVLSCVCWVALQPGSPAKPTQALEPLVVAAGGGSHVKALPNDTLVLSVAEGAEVVAPFALREDPSAVGGMALVLPKGSRTKEHKGKARLALQVPPVGQSSGLPVAADGGKFHAWARVYWRDSCSNSASLQVADAPPREFGNDCLYNCWHWVSAGQFALPPGKVPVALVEREDGVALDQLLFTRDAAYVPVGPISRAGEARGVRRFADDFARSPGHGTEAWELLNGKWYINFSFDPNRIPNQYTLVGEAAAAPPATDASHEPRAKSQEPTAKSRALALVKGTPWYGCRLAFSFSPLKDGVYGAVLDRNQDGTEALFLGFHVAGEKVTLETEGLGLHESVDVTGSVRLNQWQRVVVERWAFVTRVWVDERMVLASYAAAPRVGKAGLFVGNGAAAFDDVDLEQIHWQGDDGAALSLPWVASADAQWYRAPGASPKALIGHAGSLTASLNGTPVREVVVEEAPAGKGRCTVIAPGLAHAADPQAALPGGAGAQPGVEMLVLRRPAWGELSARPAAASLLVAGEEACVRRVAVRYGDTTPTTFTFGPYHFTESKIPDPSDYLDFTPEEFQRMQQSPEADKLLRQQKFIPLVGDKSEELGLWLLEGGHWRVKDGLLRGVGPAAVLRHAYDLTGDMEFRCRVRLREPNSAAEVELYAGPEPGVRVQLTAGKAITLVAPRPALNLPLYGDENWHDLRIRVTGGTVTAALDRDAPSEAPVTRGDGGRILLKVPLGHVEFDDIEIVTNPRRPDGCLYTFQQQETDWWRTGAWVDHAGNACVLASNWISLVAPKGEGMLWSKRDVGPDMLVGFDIEEGSEWFGWNKPHQGHVHHPFDNIRVVLAPPHSADVNRGYRLEVNSQNRSATVLYRNGKEVARVTQDGKFPIHYEGGHAPYSPRRNHITLVKRGALLRVIINAIEVLRFTDPEPLVTGQAGLGGYDTRINFAHVEVRRVGAAPCGRPASEPGGDDDL